MLVLLRAKGIFNSTKTDDLVVEFIQGLTYDGRPGSVAQEFFNHKKTRRSKFIILRK